MIYYKDTIAFAKKHHLSILQIIDKFENQFGKLKIKPRPHDGIQYFNWISWFIWNNMMREIIYFMER